MSKSLWYAEGLRWLGSLFNGAAEHFEHAARTATDLDPRMRHLTDEYLSDARHRAHIHF